MRRCGPIALSLLCGALVGGCDGVADDWPVTHASVAEIQARQEWWQAHRPATYRFDYSESGFINPGPTQARVYVDSELVDGATALRGGQVVPLDDLYAYPPVSVLFRWALHGAQNGTLRSIAFDTTYGYPSHLELTGSGLSGVLTVSRLTPTPGPSAAGVEALLARWQATILVSYRYDLTRSGFGSPGPLGVRVWVHGEHVDSATTLPDGRRIPPGELAALPTVTGLYRQALAAAQNGSLRSFHYNGVYTYPAHFVVAGQPGDSGTVTATNLLRYPDPAFGGVRYALVAVDGVALPALRQAAPLDTSWVLEGQTAVNGARAEWWLHQREWTPYTSGWHEETLLADYAYEVQGASVRLLPASCYDICDPGWVGRVAGDTLVLTHNELPRTPPVFTYLRTTGAIH